MNKPAVKPSLFSALLGPLTGADQLVLEKARLEAFLNAFPGEYCGFHQDGSVAYSDGFCALLGISGVRKIEDIQAALETADSAALEGQYLALEEEKRPFSIKVHSEGRKKTLRLRGATGAAVDGRDRFNIIWAEDISEEDDAFVRLRRAREEAEKQLGLIEGGLDTLPLPAWLRDGAGQILWANKAYAAMLGVKPADIVPAQTEIIISAKSGGIPPRDMARDALQSGKTCSAGRM